MCDDGVMLPKLRVESVLWNDADTHVQAGCVALWDTVWPTVTGAESLDQHSARYAQLAGHQIHVGLDGAEVISVARTFEHTVDLAGTPQRVIALASVCSHPDRRGEGWGNAVVEAALSSASPTVPALFQTGVRGFYERLGSAVIANPITTSVPDVDAFTDTWVMVHPGRADWDETLPIDLLSGGW